MTRRPVAARPAGEQTAHPLLDEVDDQIDDAPLVEATRAAGAVVVPAVATAAPMPPVMMVVPVLVVLVSVPVLVVLVSVPVLVVLVSVPMLVVLVPVLMLVLVVLVRMVMLVLVRTELGETLLQLVEAGEDVGESRFGHGVSVGWAIEWRSRRTSVPAW